LLGIVPNWLLYLATYVVAKVCYQSSIVIYDSMLTDITTPERMDLVSSQGFAWGYIGSCIPFLAALVLYLLGTKDIIPLKLAILLDFLLVAVWWFWVTIPLLRTYKQNNYVENSGGKIQAAFIRLGATLKDIYKNEKKVLFFLIGFFFYIDGVSTIIDEAVAIGTALGLGQVGLLVVLLLTQVVAFAFATLFSKLTEKYENSFLISVCIGGYIFVAIYALFMHTLWQFGIMAFIVGMFQGAIQALSRSYYAQIIPAETSGEYFGLYDICGKGAAFMGTTLMAAVTQITGRQNIGVASIVVIFLAGFLVFTRADRACRTVLGK
jgi:UMF1 family MFS transporter